MARPMAGAWLLAACRRPFGGVTIHNMNAAERFLAASNAHDVDAASSKLAPES